MLLPVLRVLLRIVLCQATYEELQQMGMYATTADAEPEVIDADATEQPK